MEANEEITPTKMTDSFKLTKNSRGYTWEIRVSTDDFEEMKKKIKERNDWANEQYGGFEE